MAVVARGSRGGGRRSRSAQLRSRLFWKVRAGPAAPPPQQPAPPRKSCPAARRARASGPPMAAREGKALGQSAPASAADIERGPAPPRVGGAVPAQRPPRLAPAPRAAPALKGTELHRVRSAGPAVAFRQRSAPFPPHPTRAWLRRHKAGQRPGPLHSTGPLRGPSAHPRVRGPSAPARTYAPWRAPPSSHVGNALPQLIGCGGGCGGANITREKLEPS
nr:atherin-like [Taeniopygia guttata]